MHFWTFSFQKFQVSLNWSHAWLSFCNSPLQPMILHPSARTFVQCCAKDLEYLSELCCQGPLTTFGAVWIFFIPLVWIISLIPPSKSQYCHVVLQFYSKKNSNCITKLSYTRLSKVYSKRIAFALSCVKSLDPLCTEKCKYWKEKRFIDDFD